MKFSFYLCIVIYYFFNLIVIVGKWVFYFVVIFLFVFIDCLSLIKFIFWCFKFCYINRNIIWFCFEFVGYIKLKIWIFDIFKFGIVMVELRFSKGRLFLLVCSNLYIIVCVLKIFFLLRNVFWGMCKIFCIVCIDVNL